MNSLNTPTAAESEHNLYQEYVDKIDGKHVEKKKPGRPKGFKMTDYSLDLQKRARAYKINEESAAMMEELCKLLAQLTLWYPNTPFIYGDYPYLTRSSGGSLVAGPWITEYADAYAYIFTPYIDLLKDKVAKDTLTYTDIKMLWLHHVTESDARKLFPNPTTDFYKRFGNNQMTTMVFAKYALDSMLSVENTGFYPLSPDFYKRFLHGAKKLALQYPLSFYASKIKDNADQILLEISMNPFKYEIKGAELYFARHKKRMQEIENLDECAAHGLSMDDVLGSPTGEGEPYSEKRNAPDSYASCEYGASIDEDLSFDRD